MRKVAQMANSGEFAATLGSMKRRPYDHLMACIFLLKSTAA